MREETVPVSPGFGRYTATEQEARRQLETRAHGLKVRLGKARAAARRSGTLAEKIALYGRVKEVAQEIRLFHRNYWTELERLEVNDP